MNNGKHLPRATERLTQKTVTCSNPDCKFHEKDATFEQATLVNIITDVLRPGAFAPAMIGGVFACTGCGWYFQPGSEDGNVKPGTVPPDQASDGTGKFKLLG